MNALVLEHESLVQEVRFTVDTFVVDLNDGRSLSIPLTWYPRLLHGTRRELENHEWIGEGEGIHWPDLDEDISIEGLIAGRHSGESQRSLGQWLKNRRPTKET
jgi:hypothetical protein